MSRNRRRYRCGGINPHIHTVVGAWSCYVRIQQTEQCSRRRERHPAIRHKARVGSRTLQLRRHIYSTRIGEPGENLRPPTVSEEIPHKCVKRPKEPCGCHGSGMNPRPTIWHFLLAYSVNTGPMTGPEPPWLLSVGGREGNTLSVINTISKKSRRIFLSLHN